jgi:hypothetical protein
MTRLTDNTKTKMREATHIQDGHIQDGHIQRGDAQNGYDQKCNALNKSWRVLV